MQYEFWQNSICKYSFAHQIAVLRLQNHQIAVPRLQNKVEKCIQEFSRCKNSWNQSQAIFFVCSTKLGATQIFSSKGWEVVNGDVVVYDHRKGLKYAGSHLVKW